MAEIETERKRRKLQKTAVFMAIDVVMVFILTWLWFYIMESTGMKDMTHGMQSFLYTIYITLCFGVYYYLFDVSWKALRGKITAAGYMK